MLESGSMSNLLEELRLSCMWIVNVIDLDTSSEVKEPRGDSQCKEEGVGQESRRVRQIPVRRCGLTDGIRREKELAVEAIGGGNKRLQMMESDR